MYFLPPFFIATTPPNVKNGAELIWREEKRTKKIGKEN